MDGFLSFVLTCAVVWQAVLTWRLAKIGEKQNSISETQLRMVKEAEERQRQLQAPRLRFVTAHRGFTDATTRPIKSTNYDGFIVTNESMLDITVDRAEFDIAVPIKEGRSVEYTRLEPVVCHGTSKVSDTDLPRRLRHGDKFEVYYSREDLQVTNMVRPMCMDTLGNRYYADFWMDYSEDNKTTTRSGPGSGYRSVQEWMAGDRSKSDEQA